MARLDPLDRGEVRYRGQDVRHDAVPRYRASVMYLHQRAALIEDTVDAALRRPYTLNVHRQRKFDRGRVIELLSALGRDAAFLEKNVADLSGGEIQITALVRALQLDPLILLLDEPTAALDGPTAAAVEQLIERWLAENDQRAMIWVSHNEAQAQRVRPHRGPHGSGAAHGCSSVRDIPRSHRVPWLRGNEGNVLCLLPIA